MSQYVARGKEQLRNVAKLVFGLSEDKPWRIEVVPHRAKRTSESNRYLWAVYAEIAKGTGFTADEVHSALKAKFLPPRFLRAGDEELMVPGSTAKLDQAEFSDYVEQVRAWAAMELGIAVE